MNKNRIYLIKKISTYNKVTHLKKHMIITNIIYTHVNYNSQQGMDEINKINK